MVVHQQVGAIGAAPQQMVLVHGGVANPSSAPMFRSTVIFPDPKSSSGKLFAEMAAVVGANNIQPIPAALVSEEDRKLWLKSDANALLYFWTKAPKVRIKVQEQLTKGCCDHGCTAINGDCSCETCCNCCWTGGLYVCMTVLPPCWLFLACMHPESHALNWLNDQQTPGAFNYGAKMYWRDHGEFSQYGKSKNYWCCSVGNSNDSVKGLKRLVFREMNEDIFNAKLKAAGFSHVNDHDGWSSNCCSALYCSHCLLARNTHIQYFNLDVRTIPSSVMGEDVIAS